MSLVGLHKVPGNACASAMLGGSISTTWERFTVVALVLTLNHARVLQEGGVGRTAVRTWAGGAEWSRAQELDYRKLKHGIVGR